MPTKFAIALFLISRCPPKREPFCYLDDRDIDWLKELWGGGSNRGVHWPIRGMAFTIGLRTTILTAANTAQASYLRPVLVKLIGSEF